MTTDKLVHLPTNYDSFIPPQVGLSYIDELNLRPGDESLVTRVSELEQRFERLERRFEMMLETNQLLDGS